MSVLDDIVSGIRGWFVLALGLTDSQIIKADQKGPRPPLPYLTVRVSPADSPSSEDQHGFFDDGAGGVEWRARGERSAVVDVQGYDTSGTTTTYQWLQDAALALTRPDVQALLDSAGLSVSAFGDVLDISQVLDTQIERRYLRSFDIGYSVRESAPAGIPEAEGIDLELTLERYEDHPDPLVVDVDIDL